MAALPIFQLQPDADGYSINANPGSTLSTKLKGGLGFYRADQLGASSNVTCTFTCDPLQYQYCRTFYRARVQDGGVEYGSVPFQMMMLLDDACLQPYQCFFATSDSDSGFKLNSQSGLTYTVSATFEVIPLTPPNTAFDAALLALFGAYGDNTDNLLAQLAILVNNQLPLI